MSDGKKSVLFSRRQKKQFAPGTFLPTPARVLAILQLCLAFSAFLWDMSVPFLEERFQVKSRLLLYQNVMGDETLASTLPTQQQEHLERNRKRFLALPDTQQQKLASHQTHLNTQIATSFWNKCQRLLHLILYEVSPFEQAWILLSVVIAILALKKTPGVAEAVWILPLLICCYGIHLFVYQGSYAEPDEALFPTEEVLINNYIKRPLSPDPIVQYSELETAWNMHLIKEWGKEIASEDSALKELQREKGLFYFNLARLELLEKHPVIRKGNEKQSGWMLILYMIWNSIFAWVISKHLKKLNAKSAEKFS